MVRLYSKAKRQKHYYATTANYRVWTLDVRGDRDPTATETNQARRHTINLNFTYRYFRGHSEKKSHDHHSLPPSAEKLFSTYRYNILVQDFTDNRHKYNEAYLPEPISSEVKNSVPRRLKEGMRCPSPQKSRGVRGGGDGYINHSLLSVSVDVSVADPTPPPLPPEGRTHENPEHTRRNEHEIHEKSISSGQPPEIIIARKGRYSLRLEPQPGSPPSLPKPPPAPCPLPISGVMTAP